MLLEMSLWLDNRDFTTLLIFCIRLIEKLEYLHGMCSEFAAYLHFLVFDLVLLTLSLIFLTHSDIECLLLLIHLVGELQWWL